MKQIEVFWSYVCYDDYNLAWKKELSSFLNSDKLKEIINGFEQKVIVVLGWDGTMLRAIKENYKKWIPFVWINFWHKWFLLNSKDIITPNMSYIERKYPLLEVEIETNWVIKKSIAVNEIDIRAWNWKMISLDISLSKRQAINIEWDGIIVSTPAGSTWYNSSLWWPIIPHTIWAFVITPKAPWHPKWQTPVLISDSEIIEIKNVWRRFFTEIYCDWKELLKIENWNTANILVKKSLDSVRLIIFSDYLDTWDNKVFQEQWFNAK